MLYSIYWVRWKIKCKSFPNVWISTSIVDWRAWVNQYCFFPIFRCIRAMINLPKIYNKCNSNTFYKPWLITDCLGRIYIFCNFRPSGILFIFFFFTNNAMIHAVILSRFMISYLILYFLVYKIFVYACETFCEIHTHQSVGQQGKVAPKIIRGFHSPKHIFS